MIGGEGLDDMVIQDVQDSLIEDEIAEADLLEMASEVVQQVDFEEKSSDEDWEINNLTLKKLREGLSLAKNIELFFLNADPSDEGSLKIKGQLQNYLFPYQEIHNELLRNYKLTKIIVFLKRAEDSIDDKDSESKDDTIQPKKRLPLIIVMRKKLN